MVFQILAEGMNDWAPAPGVESGPLAKVESVDGQGIFGQDQNAPEKGVG